MNEKKTTRLMYQVDMYNNHIIDFEAEEKSNGNVLYHRTELRRREEFWHPHHI